MIAGPTTPTQPMTIDPKRQAELAHDLQLGIARTSVPDYDEMPMIGMAGILAIHLRGLGEIDYQVLRQVSEYFFDIPAMVLDRPLRILEEVDYVTLVSSGKSIKKVVPNIPHFDSVYSGLGTYLAAQHLTEHEEVSLAILAELSNKPEKRDALFGRLGADKQVFTRCESIATDGGIVVSKRARGQDILVSPAYFADSLDSLAGIAAAGGASRIARLIELVKQTQGWPLSLIATTGEINGSKISKEDFAILNQLLSDGVMKPPSIERPNNTTEHFVFTPKPGSARLSAGNREIYERAMALVAAMRKGQLLPEAFRIKFPSAMLTKLRDYKKIGANSEASHQYKSLVALRVGRLVKAGYGHEFHLIDTPENMAAINEALTLLRGGSSALSNVQDEARIALTQDEHYVQSLVASKKLREVKKPTLSAEGQLEVEQLLLGI